MMPDGDSGGKVELVSNIPLGDSTAARFVAYRDKKGGYIDQVEGLLMLVNLHVSDRQVQ